MTLKILYFLYNIISLFTLQNISVTITLQPLKINNFILNNIFIIIYKHTYYDQWRLFVFVMTDL